MLGNKILNALENSSFAYPVMHLKLRRRNKEDYRKVGKSETGLDYQVVPIMCCLVCFRKRDLKGRVLSKVCSPGSIETMDRTCLKHRPGTHYQQ